MTNKLKLMATASGVAVAVLGITPAFASGTTAGTQFTNTASVAFQVGGVNQTAINASNTITVDRKVTVLVETVDTTFVTVSPNQSNAVTTFRVTNQSNATIDVGLALSQLSGVAGPFSAGTDNFNVTNVRYFVETGGTAGYDATDTDITASPYLDQLIADGVRTVYIVADVPSTQVNNDVAAIALIGQAREADTSGAQGIVITATAGANNNNAAGTFDTVLFDLAGTDDAANDGRSSSRDAYKVAAATLTVTKLSRVIQDPVNGAGAGGTSDPFAATPNADAKMIPGAVVEYCITVANATGSASATTVNITDVLPTQTTYISSGSFGVFEAGTVASGVCSGGTNTGTYNAGATRVDGTLGTVAAGATKTLYFRVTIN